MSVNIVELSIAVLNVDIKIVNASLTQNQCLQCVTPSLERMLNTATARRH